MKTLTQEWELYRAVALAKNAKPKSVSYVKRAFMAGVLTTLEKCHTCADLPDDQALKAMDALLTESIAIGEQIQVELRDQQDPQRN